MQTMRTFHLAVILVAGALASSAAPASELDDDAFAKALEGTYILFEKDGFQRVLSFSRGGNVTQVSNQEKSIGYTSGLGTWKRTGADHIRARVIDFEFDLDEGAPTGVAVVDFDITLSKEALAQYQALSGRYSVRSYATGQDPLSPSEAPRRTHNEAFTGSRVAVPETP
jgi:hypothetical protein